DWSSDVCSSDLLSRAASPVATRVILALGLFAGALGPALARTAAIRTTFAVGRASRLAALGLLAAVGLGRLLRSLIALKPGLADRFLGRTDVDANGPLGAFNAVEGRTRDQVAIKRDGAARVVVAGDRMADPVRIAVRIDDCDDRHMKLARFGDRDRFLVGVEHEQEVRQRAHVFDAAERPRELLFLAG